MAEQGIAAGRLLLDRPARRGAEREEAEVVEVGVATGRTNQHRLVGLLLRAALVGLGGQQSPVRARKLQQPTIAWNQAAEVELDRFPVALKAEGWLQAVAAFQQDSRIQDAPIPCGRNRQGASQGWFELNPRKRPPEPGAQLFEEGQLSWCLPGNVVPAHQLVFAGTGLDSNLRAAGGIHPGETQPRQGNGCCAGPAGGQRIAPAQLQRSILPAFAHPAVSKHRNHAGVFEQFP